MVAFKNKLYFQAMDLADNVGKELYCYDPTATTITRPAAGNNIEIYPNPSQNYFNIKGLKGTAVYTIYSISGRVVQQGNATNGRINHKLTSGTYVLQTEGNALKLIVR